MAILPILCICENVDCLSIDITITDTKRSGRHGESQGRRRLQKKKYLSVRRSPLYPLGPLTCAIAIGHFEDYVGHFGYLIKNNVSFFQQANPCGTLDQPLKGLG